MTDQLDFEYLLNTNKKDQTKANELFPVEVAREARKFHRQIPGYRVTPLRAFPNLAQMLGVGGIYIKDEAERLELNSFKVMGGSFAIYRFLKKYLHILHLLNAIRRSETSHSHLQPMATMEEALHGQLCSLV